MISRLPQSQLRKLFVGAFRFLQTDYAGLGFREPGEETVLPFAQRVDIPRDDPH
jgi:hypothetical protein